MTDIEIECDCNDGIDWPVECECYDRPLLPPPWTFRAWYTRSVRRRLPRRTATWRWLPWWARHPGLSLDTVSAVLKEIYLPIIAEQLYAPNPWLDRP